jgi:hypothetical protein
MCKYLVTISDIEWDVGKNPVEDGYDLEYIKNLPSALSIRVNADDSNDAIERALDDISQDFGFLIQGCKPEAKNIT